MADEVQQQVRSHWQAISSGFPENTPANIVEALRVTFMGMIEEDPSDVLIITERKGVVSSRLRPGIATAFARQAVEQTHALRSRTPTRRLAVHLEDMPRVFAS